MVPLLLKQARKLSLFAVHKAVRPNTAAYASRASVQMFHYERFRWPLYAQPFLLSAVRLSGWDAVSMQEEAVIACESRRRDLEIAFEDPDTRGFSKEELLVWASQLDSCRQWVLLLPAGLPQARKLVLLKP